MAEKEVKPRHKTITVWGVCDWKGKSMVFHTKPHRRGPRNTRYVNWGLSYADFDLPVPGPHEGRQRLDEYTLDLREPDLFPKDKPQAFELVIPEVKHKGENE